jgi:hypothetical protein
LAKAITALEDGGFLGGPRSITTLLDGTSPEELEIGRSAARAILEAFGLHIASLLAQHGTESTGLRFLTEVPADTIRTRLTFVAGFIALRRSGLGDRIDTLVEQARAVAPVAHFFFAYTRAYPQFKAFAPSLLRGEVEKLPAEVIAALRQVKNSMPEEVLAQLPTLQQVSKE